jgi:hypothetical protein
MNMKSKMITSVGYHFTLSREQLNYITAAATARCDNSDFSINPTDTFACVWYHGNHGGKSDGFKSQNELREWYLKKSEQVTRTAYLRQIYVKKNVIVGAFDCEADRFLAVLVDNSKGVDPTQIKRQCNSGQLGKPITLERQTVQVAPYINEVSNN